MNKSFTLFVNLNHLLLSISLDFAFFALLWTCILYLIQLYTINRLIA